MSADLRSLPVLYIYIYVYGYMNICFNKVLKSKQFLKNNNLFHFRIHSFLFGLPS